MGLTIHLSGPCFAGKSYLISKLIYDFPDLKVILFEGFLRAGNKLSEKYGAFYQAIYDSASIGNVIAESIYSSENNILKCNFDNILNIVCFPNYKDHQSNLNKYIQIFGKDDLFRFRTGRVNLTMLREDYLHNGHPKTNCILYNLHNYENVKKEVEKCI
jgi:hypothetical protein